MAWTYVCWARSSNIWEWRNVCSQLLWRTIAHSRMLQNDLSECYCIEEFIIIETIELHFVRVGEIAYCVPTRYQLHIVYRHVTNCILFTDTLPIAYCVPIRYQLHIVYRHVTNCILCTDTLPIAYCVPTRYQFNRTIFWTKLQQDNTRWFAKL
jgi:hypothetical protein